MSKPYIHALSSAKRHGGVPEDYIDIHNLMDSSKAAMADNRHRALTHNAWFIGTILEKVFGVTRKNSAGRVYSVRSIGEEHVLEDFKHKFIPSAQDYLAEIPYAPWMQNGGGKGTLPPSAAMLYPRQETNPLDTPVVFDQPPLNRPGWPVGCPGPEAHPTTIPATQPVRPTTIPVTQPVRPTTAEPTTEPYYDRYEFKD